MGQRVAKRDPDKETFWRQAIRQQQSSGLSIRGWCREHGQSEALFHFWRRELARRDEQERTAAFVPIRVTEVDTDKDVTRLEIVLVDGRRIRLAGSVDRQMLADVLAVMERSPC